MNTTVPIQNTVKNSRIVLETLLVTMLSLCGILFLPQWKAVFVLLPIAYLLMERRIRQRSWSELGFKFSSFWSDLRANWFWFVLAGVISQPAWFFLERAIAPEILDHVLERLPFPATAVGLAVYALPLAVVLIGEELTHRTLIQGRLTPFIGATAAIAVASLVFGVSHYSAGPFWVVALDITSIVFDSVLFGIIYARSNNLIVSWTAHLLGDILALAMLISL